MQESEFWLTRIKFFVGVVESRGQDDPKRAGRVKVRCHGVHTSDKGLLPTDHLMWAMVGQPVTSAAVSGIGRTPTGIVEGTQVFGVFLDQYCQQPLVLATLGGASMAKANPSAGFNDPSGTYPLEDLLGQPDITRLADERAEEHPSMVLKRTSRTQEVPVARTQDIDKEGGFKSYIEDGDIKWSEPNPRYGSKDPWGDKGREFLAEVVSSYPLNHVTESESGHVLEMDDTPGAERLHLFHRTGTFAEIQQDGTMVRKIVADDFEIVARDKNVMVRGNCNLTVNGNARVKVSGSMVQEVGGDYTLIVGGDKIEKVQGSQGTEIGRDRSVRVAGDDYGKISGDLTSVVNLNRATTIGGTETTNIGGNRTTRVGALAAALFGGASDTTSVTGDIWTGADGNMTDVVGGDKAATVGGKDTRNVVRNVEDTVGGNVVSNIQGKVTETVIGKVTQVYKSLKRTVAGTTSLLGGKMTHNRKNVGGNHKHSKVKIGTSLSGGPLP